MKRIISFVLATVLCAVMFSSCTEQKANSNTTTRRTTTSDGVTIIDDRNEEKKIFNQGDGEYVEFEEV